MLPQFFGIQPQIWAMNPPRATVQDAELLITGTRAGNDAEARDGTEPRRFS